LSLYIRGYNKIGPRTKPNLKQMSFPSTPRGHEIVGRRTYSSLDRKILSERWSNICHGRTVFATTLYPRASFDRLKLIIPYVLHLYFLLVTLLSLNFTIYTIQGDFSEHFTRTCMSSLIYSNQTYHTHHTHHSDVVIQVSLCPSPHGRMQSLILQFPHFRLTGQDEVILP
jgi:hypothetical protein